MKASATPSGTHADNGPKLRHQTAPYQKVLDGRKQPIRGLWKRNDRFYARISVENDDGSKQVRRIPLENATTVAQAQAELRRLLTHRESDTLPAVRQGPTIAKYIETYLERLKHSGKRPATIVKESGCLEKWSEAIGHLRLEKLRPHFVTSFLDELKKGRTKEDGEREHPRSGRTVNLYLIVLRNSLKAARVDGHIKTLPIDGLPWQRVDTRKRSLITASDLDTLCTIALDASKNGPEFVDYLRFLAFSGARRNEALRVRWEDVDFHRHQVAIGADGSSKNRQPRHVNFNPNLERHLQEMKKRRAPDSQWLFPSPQRGEKDVPAKSFKESLALTKQASGTVCSECHARVINRSVASCSACGSTAVQFEQQLLPRHLRGLGFHDLRHFFISFAVMSGVDFMTIARWVGHKDGGILIGKVYGHLSDEHAQRQAAKINFGPSAIEPGALASAAG